jgi:cytolysin (calcineurin-like family phosphatase)
MKIGKLEMDGNRITRKQVAPATQQIGKSDGILLRYQAALAR